MYVAAEAASQLQEGQMFNVIARLAQDDQGNLMVRPAARGCLLALFNQQCLICIAD